MGLLLVSLVVLILVIVAAFAMPARTAPITDANRMPVPGSVAILEDVTIGGVKQSVLVRGRSARNPVLLFLHGGPGTSELGMLRAFNIPALEHHFTVVVWDQRGAGKSFAALEPASGMTVEQLISDAHELTLWLRQRFAQEKIYLVGHSWGSALGVLAVGRRPELYHAYVGFGQVVNMREGERISYEWALARAQEARDSRSVAKLKAIGPPPYSGDLRSKVIAQRKILGKYGGELYGSRYGGFFVLLACLLKAREYSWRDRINVFRGIFASMRLLWPQILSINLMGQAPELRVPVYFLEGRHDYEAPSALVEQYYQAVRAPSKTLVWFENSAHFVNTEEPDAFNRFFVDRLRVETHRPASTQ